MRRRKPIRIINTNFEVQGEIENYQSFIGRHRYHSIGDAEMKVNKYVKNTDMLLKGNILLMGSDLNKAFIIKHRNIALDNNGKSSENWNIKAYSLQSILTQRITIPTYKMAYDSITGDAETVMKHYIENNIVNPDNEYRQIPNFVIAPNKHRGEELSWASRYKNLADEIEEISRASGLGWMVYLDLKNKQFVFDVYEGKNLTNSQAVNPPVIFSPEFASLESMNFTESEINYKNVALVAGQGEGVDRTIYNVTRYQRGLDRYEVFIDARDISNTMEIEVPDGSGGTTTETVNRPELDVVRDLVARGNQKLNEMSQEKYLEGQILTHSPFIYEEDYNLGDIPTLQNKDWGVTMDARLTEIEEVYEENGFKLSGTFGNNIPTLIDKIKQEFKQSSGEIRK